MKKAVVFGIGDFAQLAAVYLREDAGYTVEAFTVHARYVTADRVLETPVVPFERLAASHPPDEFDIFCAVGYSGVNAHRRAIYEACASKGYRRPAYVHSTVRLSKEVAVGEGCFIFENAVIQPFVSIGRNCVLWSGAHVLHHSTIGDHVFIAGGVVVSGRCTVGDNAFIGANATLRDGVSVAPNCVVGAGALLLKDTLADGVYKAVSTAADERRSYELSRI